MLCIRYLLSAEGDGESSGLSAGAAAAAAFFPTALVMCALGAAIGGLVGWYVAKKRAVPGAATKSGGELVLEQKTALQEGGEVEEQMD